MNQIYGSALQGHGGAAASAVPTGEFTNGHPLTAWRAPLEEDEVDAYDHLSASTDEDIEMNMGGPDYLTWSGAAGEPMTPPPGPATHPYCSMGSSSWQGGQMPAGAHFAPSPASTETSAGGTRPARRHRRRLEGGVEFAVHTKPAPGGLGRVLDQKRVRLDRQRMARGSGAGQRRGARRRRWAETEAIPDTKGVAHQQVSITASAQVAEPQAAGRVPDADRAARSNARIEEAGRLVVSDEEEKEAARDCSQEVDSGSGLEPVREGDRAAPTPAHVPAEIGATGPGLTSSTSNCIPPPGDPSSGESKKDGPGAAQLQPTNADLDSATASSREALDWLNRVDWSAQSRAAQAQAIQAQMHQSQAYEDFLSEQNDDDSDL